MCPLHGPVLSGEGLALLVRQDADAARVVGLHVVDHQVIRGAALQDLLQVGQPLLQLAAGQIAA